MKWPTGAPVISGRADPREHVVELARLAADRAVRVDDALRVAGGAGGEADERGRVGVDRRSGSASGSASSRSANGVARGGQRRRPACRRPPASGGPGRSASSVVVDGEVVGVAEAVGGDDDGRLGGLEDVVDLLGAVEVHDRHDDGAEVGGGPERDAGLDPVRQLEHDDVAGPDAAGAAATRPGAGPPGRRRRTCRPRAHLRPHVELDVRRSCARPVGHHLPERGVGPPALGQVALGQVAGTARSPQRSRHPSPASATERSRLIRGD